MICASEGARDESTSTSSEEFVDSPSAQDSTGKNFFNDNKREIDFILVATDQTIETSKQQVYIYRYIRNLEENGLQFEVETGTVSPPKKPLQQTLKSYHSSKRQVLRDLIFIKVHAPKDVLLRYAEAFKIRLEFKTYERQIGEHKIFCKCMRSELTRPNPKGSVFHRARATISGEKPTSIITIERIMVVEALLSHAAFGSRDLQYGLGKLLDRRAFIAAYPLHDGAWDWTKKGPLNDRQLLANYWAKISVWYKEQPLNVVQKYYGPEVAFYFAFYGFYNKMLIPASIIGLICFSIGLIDVFVINKQPIVELCSSTAPLCPMFLRNRNWKTVPLKNFCTTMKLNYMFDNYATVFFALFMAFWSTLFMELWKRKHATLMYRWHLKSQYEDVSWSQEYAEHTPYRRLCPVTGNYEPYMPIWVQMINYSITCITLCFMIFIVIIAVIGTIMFRLMLSEIINYGLLIMICAATMNVFFIKLFGKGKFFTYPGYLPRTLFQNIVQGDVCPPAGCILGVGIQLTFIMLLKSLVGNICVHFIPPIKQYYKKHILKVKRKVYEPPQWELDYNLQEMGRYFLIKEYSEIILQYGLVTFFVAAFPLAPLCAFINNMLEIRTDASKFVKHCRRPIPVRIGGIQAWNGILQGMTFLSMITNAFVIAFTSDFVKREIFKHNVDNKLKGFVNSTLSKFSIADINRDLREASGVVDNNTCYYPGTRHPPEHPNKYKLTPDYWYEICIRLLVAFVFEHIVILFTGLIAYAVPDVPYSLKRLIKVQREERKAKRLKRVHEGPLQRKKK